MKNNKIVLAGLIGATLAAAIIGTADLMRPANIILIPVAPACAPTVNV